MMIPQCPHCSQGMDPGAQTRSCKWAVPKSCILKMASLQHSPINKGIQKASLSMSHCKDSFRENSWGGALRGVSLQSSSSLVNKYQPQHWNQGVKPTPTFREMLNLPQTPNPTLLPPQPKQPQGKTLPHEKSVFSAKIILAQKPSMKKLNLILKVFSNLNDFMTNLKTAYLQFSPWPTTAPHPPLPI